MTSGLYTKFKYDLMKKLIDLSADTLKICLVGSGYSFSDADTAYSDISANEISGTGYTSGGATLANLSVTEGTTTKFDADDVQWTTATLTAYGAAIYDTSNSNHLIAFIDFGGAQAVTNGTLKIEWDSDGIITLA